MLIADLHNSSVRDAEPAPYPVRCGRPTALLVMTAVPFVFASSTMSRHWLTRCRCARGSRRIRPGATSGPLSRKDTFTTGLPAQCRWRSARHRAVQLRGSCTATACNGGTPLLRVAALRKKRPPHAQILSWQPISSPTSRPPSVGIHAETASPDRERRFATAHCDEKGVCMDRAEDNVAIVTGAARGQGRGHAHGGTAAKHAARSISFHPAAGQIDQLHAAIRAKRSMPHAASSAVLYW